MPGHVAEPVEQGRGGLVADARRRPAARRKRRRAGSRSRRTARRRCRTCPAPTRCRHARACRRRGRCRAPGRRPSSSTSWNRSRSPVTTSTGWPAPVASVPITSSASACGAPMHADPERVEHLQDERDLDLERVRHLLDVRPRRGRAATTRCALYDGSRSTRHWGRQSSSQQQTRSVGWYSPTSRAIMSSSPRTALTGVPSGAVISGTPKKARKYIEAVSRSISRPWPACFVVTRRILSEQVLVCWP